MNKSQLIDALAARYEGNRKAAAHALESVLDTITREVAKGEKVAITGFGSFEKRVRKAGWARNPATGERIKTKKKAVPKFSPGAELKNVVSGAKKLPKLTMSVAKATPAAVAATAKKAAPGKTASATKATAKKSTPAKKAAASKSTAKAPAKKSTAKKTSTSKSTASKSTPASKTSASKSTAKKTSASKSTPAKKASASKSTAKKAPAKKTAKKA